MRRFNLLRFSGPHKILLFYFLAFLSFWYIAANFHDPDFGQHLQTGRLILTSGVPRTDPFSYTMPHFPYVTNAWLFDVAIALLFPSIGLWGMGVIAAAIVTTAMYIALSSLRKTAIFKRNPSFYFSFGFLTAAVFLSQTVVRPLVITWLFLAILVYLLTTEKFWQKWKPTVPLLFLFWANLHAGFVAGLGALSIWILVRFLENKKLSPFDLGLWLASIAATLINPYQLGLWRDAWATIVNLSATKTIGEWKSILYYFSPAAVVLMIVSLGLVLRFQRQYFWRTKLLLMGFFLASLSSIRNIPLFAIVAIAIVGQGLPNFFKIISRNRLAADRLVTAGKLSVIFCAVLFAIYLLLGTRQVNYFAEEKYYPKLAVEYLKNHLPNGQIFSTYEWGSYLVWKLPEKKVFIDGWMAYWKENPVSQDDSPNAFREYMQITRGLSDSRALLAKYGIDTLLLPSSQREHSPLETIMARFFGGEKEFFEFISSRGWVKVYDDKVAVIYTLRGEKSSVLE